MKHHHALLKLIGLPFVSICAAGVADAGTLFVDDDGGGDYTTISEAVANAVNGDVIIVAPGTYVEDVIVDVEVTITGAGVGQTIVLPATSVPGAGLGSQVDTTTWIFRIQADNVILNGLTIDGDNPALSTGIDARGGVITDYTAGVFNNLEVMSCELKNFVHRAVALAAGGSGHTIQLNDIRNALGVHLESGGVFCTGGSATIQGNTISDCSIGIGLNLGGGGLVADNAVADCYLGVLTSGGTLPVTIRDNTIASCTQGVQSLAPDTTVSVVHNTVTGCISGLVFYGGGTGNDVADGNVVDGLGMASTSGVYASTDASAYGYGNLTLLLVNNELRNNQNGLVLNENPFNNAWILDCTLSGDPNLYNAFWGNLSYNVLLQNCQDDVDARHNAWGAVNPILIENTLYHQVDDPSLGLIDYSNPVYLYLTVDDDGLADFSSVNPAVQSLLPGGTIKVMPGHYQEDFLIDRSCRIEGSGTDPNALLGTTFSGLTVDINMDVITVTASDVVIENLRIDGWQPSFGEARRCVYASGVSGLAVNDCAIHTAITGILYDSSTQGSFLRNEVYDFGANLNIGGGIYLSNSNADIGTPGNGNDIHDGLSPGVVFTSASSGAAAGNLVDGGPLGFLANGSDAQVTFEANEARNCGQGFQSIANLAPVNFRENTVYDCETGFMQYGLGAQLHTYTENHVHHRTGSSGSTGFFLTTECPLGDDDLQARLIGNVISGADYGIVLDESTSSVLYTMAVDLSGGANPNWITGAAVQDILLQMCDDDIPASGNYFGSTEPSVVEDKITHQVDDGALGLVDFSGLVPIGPEIRRRGDLARNREIALIMTGFPGDMAAPFYANGPANIDLAWGTLLIDPLSAVLLGVKFVNPDGVGFFEVPFSDELPPGITFYFQALGGAPGRWVLTINADTVTTR